jgi:hypothetical protein
MPSEFPIHIMIQERLKNQCKPLSSSCVYFRGCWIDIHIPSQLLDMRRHRATFLSLQSVNSTNTCPSPNPFSSMWTTMMWSTSKSLFIFMDNHECGAHRHVSMCKSFFIFMDNHEGGAHRHVSMCKSFFICMGYHEGGTYRHVSTQHVFLSYISLDFYKRQNSHASSMAAMPPYIDPETGLRRYTKVGTGTAEDLYPVMTRYTRLHHTMNTMWETMEHVAVVQKSNECHFTPIQCILMDGMLSGGVAEILSTLLEEREKQNTAKVLNSIIEADQETCDTMRGQDSTQPDQETRYRKSNLQVAKFNMSHIYPDYKTVCAGVKLHSSTPQKTPPRPGCLAATHYAQHVCSSACRPMVTPKHTIGSRYNAQLNGGRAVYRKTHVTPRGIYDKTTRFPLHH